MIRLDKTRLVFLWRRGGNWVVFLLLWIVSAAIIGAIESSTEDHQLSEEARMELEARAMVAGLTEMKAQVNVSSSQEHIEKLIQLISRKEFPRVWVQGEDEFEEHVEVLRVKLSLMQEEFARVMGGLEQEDREGRAIASELISLLADNQTLHIMDQVAQARRVAMEAGRGEEWGEDLGQWDFGDSLHFVSTVFTTIGYGVKTPMTAGGKFLTIMMVIILIPFFLHCLCTSATLINSSIDRALGLSEHYDDLEDLTAEKRNDNLRLRRQAVWKGSLILLAALSIHLFLSSIYHVFSTGWNYGDVLYYEFITYSTIGFGDLMPEDDLSVAGAILKNILVKIPAAVVLLSLFLRLLPVIS